MEWRTQGNDDGDLEMKAWRGDPSRVARCHVQQIHEYLGRRTERCLQSDAQRANHEEEKVGDSRETVGPYVVDKRRHGGGIRATCMAQAHVHVEGLSTYGMPSLLWCVVSSGVTSVAQAHH